MLDDDQVVGGHLQNGHEETVKARGVQYSAQKFFFRSHTVISGAIHMTAFRECPNPDCGKTAEGEPTIWNVYECENCGGYFCPNCSDGGDCPHCGSDEYNKIGTLVWP